MTEGGREEGPESRESLKNLENWSGQPSECSQHPGDGTDFSLHLRKTAACSSRQGEQMGLEQVVYGLRGTDCCCALQWSSDASRHVCAAQQCATVLSLKGFIFHSFPGRGMRMCLHTRECSFLRVQKRAWGPLELELQVVVSPPTWLLGLELRSSVRVVQVLHHSDISPASRTIFFF